MTFASHVIISNSSMLANITLMGFALVTADSAPEKYATQ